MKIGCGSVLFREYELERSLEAIRKIGFEYFETQAVGPWCPHVDVEKDDPETLVRLKNKFGFKEITGLWALNGNIIANPKSVDSVTRTIEFAAAAGIPIVHMGDGSKPKEMDDEEAYRVLEDKMAKILEAARKNGVKVALEPHGTFSLTKAGLQRLLTLGSPDVLGVNFDACNIFRASYVESGNNKSGWAIGEGKENEVEVMEGVADRIIHCHAKDINSERRCVSVGSGIVNVKGCIELLKKIGYEGVVSVETEGGGTFEEIVQLATESYNYLNSVIKGE